MKEQEIKITKKQAELWKVAENTLQKIGGLSGISRNPEPAVRERSKTQGTREWALLESSRLAAGCNDEIMTDEYCQKLINIIEEVAE